MRKELKVIVGFTPYDVFNLEESSLLRVMGFSELRMFEYVLAQWNVLRGLLLSGRADWFYDQLVGDLGEMMCWDGEPTDKFCEKQLADFGEVSDDVAVMVQRLMGLLEPIIGELSEGYGPHRQVEHITYHPHGYRSSILHMHLDDPILSGIPRWT